MKIDYAIVSADDSTGYINFWPTVRSLWQEAIGIKPILVLISNRDEIIDAYDYKVHIIKKNKIIKLSTQAQIARMYVTQFYPNETCITSDIDMLPLNKEYFTKTIEEVPAENIAIMTSDAPNDRPEQRFPICYNAALGSTFKDILDLSDSFEEYCERLKHFYWRWDTDELYFGKMISEWKHQDRISLFNRGFNKKTADKRIDRKNWKYSIQDLEENKYIDCHCEKNYNNNKKEIELITNTTLKYYS